MKKTLIQLIIFSAFTAFGQTTSSTFNAMLNVLLDHSVPAITVKDAASRQNQATFLDAREINEYKVSHLKDAIYIGYEDFSLNSVKNLKKEQEIIVYCSIGYRSEKIAEKLQDAGFVNVSNLYGGIFEWKNQANLIYDINGKTNRIHAYNAIWGIWLTSGDKVYE